MPNRGCGKLPRGPSIFPNKSGRGRVSDLSRKNKGPLLAGYKLPCKTKDRNYQ